MFHKLFLLACLLISFLARTQVADTVCRSVLTGTLIDADTREPITQAAIILIRSGKSLRLRPESNQMLATGLCAGEYDLRVEHPGCMPLQVHFHLKDSLHLTLTLTHAAGTLQEVVVEGQVSSRLKGYGEVKGTALAALRGTSLGEQLMQIAGVTVLQTGSNIYKPVIHGLHSNRILMLNNGIRQEGQHWGSEHAPEIDPFIANRLVVVKGAQTVQYGGDAIGGVILVEPKLLSRIPGTHGEVNLAAFSNNRMGVANLMLEGILPAGRGLGWRVQGSVRRGGSGRTPLYYLDNSALSEQNFSLTAGWERSHSQHQVFYSNFNTKLAIFSGAHIGNVTDLLIAVSSAVPPDYIRSRAFTYNIDRPYQQVQHQLFKWKSQWSLPDSIKATLQLSAQRNQRSEFDIRQFSSSSAAPQLALTLYTLAADYSFEKTGRKRQRIIWGGNTSWQQNQFQSRYFIPDYQALSQGLFVIHKFMAGQWEPEGGVRADHRRLFLVRGRGGNGLPDQQYTSVTGHTAITLNIRPGHRLTGQLSSAWRPPQVNELYASGLHHGAARIEAGDASLKPERASSAQLGWTLLRKTWSMEVNVYAKKIDGFIFLRPDYPPQLTVRGAFPSFAYNQTEALLTGLDLNGSVRFTAHLSAAVQGSFLRARDQRAGDWIVQMPADRGTLSLQYTFANTGTLNDAYIKATLNAVDRQRRVPSQGNIPVKQPDGSLRLESDYLAPPPGYVLAGLETAGNFRMGGRPLSLIVSATNLLNHRYRDYQNAFRYYADELGSNYSVRLQLPFSFKNHTRKTASL